MAVSQSNVVSNPVVETKVVETKVKKTKVVQTNVFLTKDEMVKESKERQKGPKKMFEVSYDGKTYYVLALNRFRAQGAVLAFLGAKVKVFTAPKPEDVAEILKSLSKAELEKILKTMK